MKARKKATPKSVLELFDVAFDLRTVLDDGINKPSRKLFGLGPKLPLL